MAVNRSRRNIFLYAPYISEKLLSAYRPATMLDEIIQDAELQRSELELISILMRGMAAEIDIQVVNDVVVNFLFVVVLSTFDNNSAARSEFVFAKGLRYVVVRSQVEPF